MWLPKNAPIRRKLRITLMITCGVALLVACTVLFGFHLLTFRQTFKRDLVALAQIISTNATAAVTFQDEEAANDILASLIAKPQITGASIFLKNGKILARSGKAKIEYRTAQAGFYFEPDDLVYIHPIVMDKIQIGTLGLHSDYPKEFAHLLEVYVAILAVVLAVSILIAFIASSNLQRLITQPILDLAETAGTIADNKDYSVRAKKIENDEVGLLTDAFNQMLAQIQVQDSELFAASEKLETQVEALRHQIAERERAESQLEKLNEQLLQASRQAGMAEVATEVLHNVGNVLNSVNVSTTLISETVGRSKIENLCRAVTLLKEQSLTLSQFLEQDPRGRVLPGYLEEVGQHLRFEKEVVQKELALLSKNIQHIKDIVAMQQTHAKAGGVIESMHIEQLVEDALQINAIAFERIGIKVVRNYQDTPMVEVDKHKILQILVNLVKNATHALAEDNACEPRTLSVTITNQAHSVQIAVTDNGTGIAPENLTRIFAHGFTTRKDGHGFGLHSGAIAAKEMGGALRATSPGLGLGATFTLELPLQIRHELKYQ